MVQALEALRKLRTEKAAEIKQFKLQLDHLKTHKVPRSSMHMPSHAVTCLLPFLYAVC